MNERGFTLMETVIYMSLCGLLLGTLLPVAYELVRAAEHDSASAAAMDEAAFIDRTLYWAMADAKDVAVPAPDVLVVTENDGEKARFYMNETMLTVSRDGKQAMPLNVGFPVTGTAFAVTPENHASITVVFTLGPSPFAFRYPLPRRGMFPSSCLQP
jgi:type II secretory pathway pseudopilin PulG